MAVKRDAENSIFMPETIGGATGAMRLSVREDNRRSRVQ